MRMTPDWLANLCRWALVLGLPVVLTLTNVRLLMTPVFLSVEYSLPDFPVDYYGFNTADRVYWAGRSLAYITSDPAAGAVESWKFADDGRAPAGTTAPANTDTCSYYGTAYGPRDCTYFYNDREIRHMLDVRQVVTATLWVWGLLGLTCLAAAGWLAYSGRPDLLRLGVLAGAAAAWAVLIFLVLFILIGFNQFFTLFHQVFFQGDSWIFLWSDSFIRLFPLKFWFDAFLFVGLATLAEAAGLAALAWWRLPAALAPVR